MYDKSTVKILFRLSQIPISIYSPDWELLDCCPSFLKEPEPFEAGRLQKLREELNKKSLCFVPYDSQVPVALCGCKGPEEIFVLGPFSYGKTHTFESRNFLRKNRIREAPPCPLDDIFSIACFLSQKEPSKEPGMDMYGEFLPLAEQGENQDLVINEEIRQLDSFQKNHTYMDEQVLYDHIKNGDVEYLEKQAPYTAPSHPILMDDLKKNEEYMTVISISLAARAAIEGGLSSAEGFLNNDIYLKKLAECKSVFEIDRLRWESQLYFARLVAQNKKKSGANLHVEEFKKSVLSKRFSKISIQEIADDLGISKEYLQKLFKKHEGISITQYISDIKIEAACNLLKYSDRKIQEISEYLQYGSVSHFSTAFRKKTGQSPKEYRDKNRKTIY